MSASILSMLFKFVFEKLPIMNLFDGKKQIIGQWLSIIGAALEAGQIQFPSVPVIGVVNGWVVMLSGLLIGQVGATHDRIKLEAKVINNGL